MSLPRSVTLPARLAAGGDSRSARYRPIRGVPGNLAAMAQLRARARNECRASCTYLHRFPRTVFEPGLMPGATPMQRRSI